ncbi:hypothetical protein Lalb_Chr15g0077801 [Lupinus albus]|uniref:Uncharacterized protein n=1 Tax=Lupinus albus TaxID=3870 RepID=A0A6A4P8Z7_LUPAL|nr:hypothetical protein Lalb_Chr15g0077801 [Lupinus albus]
MSMINENYNNIMMLKRQLFLRSYKFSRKKNITEKIKGSLALVKKVLWPTLKSSKKFVLSRFRIKCGFNCRRTRFSRLLKGHKHKFDSCSKCFC